MTRSPALRRQPLVPHSPLSNACGALIDSLSLKRSARPRLYAGAMAFSLLASMWPAPAASSTVSASVNAWLGGYGTDWFTSANWSGGNVLALPDPLLPTAISPVRETVAGIPTGTWFLPQSEAVLGGAFATPSFSMQAWGGVSQLRLVTGGLLTTSATIGTVSAYAGGGPLQAATVVLDGGRTAGSWNFLENSRVVVRGHYDSASTNWSGTLGTLEIVAGASFALNGSLAVNSIVNNSTSFALASGSTAGLRGSVANAGVFTIDGDSTRGVALARLTADTTLSGAGSTVLSHKDYSVIGATSSARTLTIATGHTLRGSGQVGSGSYSGINVVNQGTVIADGHLSYYGSGFDNSAGLVQVADGATFSNGGTITGGTVRHVSSSTSSARGARLFAASESATATDAILAGSGTYKALT
ncbi:MAG: hypothetical protein EOP39_17575, partial [Rubrivivax sp.]